MQTFVPSLFLLSDRSLQGLSSASILGWGLRLSALPPLLFLIAQKNLTLLLISLLAFCLMILLHISWSPFHSRYSGLYRHQLISKHLCFITQILHMGKPGHGEVSQFAQHHRQKEHSLKSAVIFGAAKHWQCLQTSFVVLSGRNQTAVDLISMHSSISYVLMWKKHLCWSVHLQNA